MGLYPAATPQIPPDLAAPSPFTYATWPRYSWSNALLTFTSGTLYLAAISLPINYRVGRLGMVSNTASSGQTNWWMAMFDVNRLMLALTANQTTTASAANVNLAIATTAAGAATGYTTTYTGIHYVGWMMAAATTQKTAPAQTQNANLAAQTPIMAGTSNTAMTTPPAFPFTATAITASTSHPYYLVGP